jgi:hypothetical protein
MSTKTFLSLAPNLRLPLESVSRTFGILAARGAGKSNTAAVMAEEMFAAKLPFVVIDPVGAWYGLRSSADGTGAGLPIPIFGGKHGDLPIERESGELVADLVVEKRLTCVIDLSQFESEGSKKRFLLAFAKRLYQKNESPLHLFLEEADDYIPQKPMGNDENYLLRAWENIVRRGRSRGLGMTMITQRSAAINKMVLTQVETLFAMRTTGPQDIAAIEAWVKYNQASKDVLATLSSLGDGEAWVWSPHFLKTMARFQIRRRATFDSGATPTNVRAADTRPPATLADVDLEALRTKMAATIEKAKTEDPALLRREIAELRKKVASLAAPPKGLIAPAELEAIRVAEYAGGRKRERDDILRDLAKIKKHFDALTESFARMGPIIDQAFGRPEIAVSVDLARPGGDRSFAVVAARRGGKVEILDRIEIHRGNVDSVNHREAGLRSVSKSAAGLQEGGKIAGVEQRILDTLAGLADLGIDRPDKATTAALVGYHPNAKSFANAIGALRSAGRIAYPTAGAIALTDEGRAIASSNLAIGSVAELHRVWFDKLGAVAQRILAPLLDAYPESVETAAIAKAAGYHPNAKSFANMKGRLRTLGLVDYPGPGQMVATAVLFPEGLR